MIRPEQAEEVVRRLLSIRPLPPLEATITSLVNEVGRLSAENERAYCAAIAEAHGDDVVRMEILERGAPDGPHGVVAFLIQMDVLAERRACARAVDLWTDPPGSLGLMLLQERARGERGERAEDHHRAGLDQDDVAGEVES